MKSWWLVLGLAVSAGLWAADPVYKWTDENGVVHYSNQKPRDQQTDEVKLRDQSPTVQSQQTSLSTADAEREAEESLLERRNREARTALCDRALEDVSRLSGSDTVYRRGPDGVESPLSDVEKASALEAARAQMKQHCNRVESVEGAVK